MKSKAQEFCTVARNNSGRVLERSQSWKHFLAHGKSFTLLLKIRIPIEWAHQLALQATLYISVSERAAVQMFRIVLGRASHYYCSLASRPDQYARKCLVGSLGPSGTVHTPKNFSQRVTFFNVKKPDCLAFSWYTKWLRKTSSRW